MSEAVLFGRKKKQGNFDNEAASHVAAQIMGRLLTDYPRGHVITEEAVAQVTDLRVLEFTNEALKVGKSPAEVAAFAEFVRGVGARLAAAYGAGGELEGTVNDLGAR